MLRLNGIRYEEDDPPWYIVACLGWLGMVKCIQDSAWEEAEGYRALLERKLKTENPAFLYEFYKRFSAFQKAAMSKKK